VPYSDSAVEYVFKKQGFETKTMYIVPNLPSPLFATMQEIEAKPAASAAAAPVPAARKTPTSTPASYHRSSSKKDTGHKPDEDEVLEPSYR
jgi:hypothetical protein